MPVSSGELGIAHGALESEAEALRQDGATAIFVGVDGKLAGVIAIADPVKATTPQALQALRDAGIRVVMLTGDNRTTAEAVAKRLGISRGRGRCPARPEERTSWSACRAKGASSPWRATASMMRRRLPPPMSASPWARAPMSPSKAPASRCSSGDLTGIVRARHLSQATMRNIRQNLFFAFIYNAAGVPVAAGVLYPFFGILLSPIIAAAAMALSSVSVIGNALRLRHARIEL